MFRLIFRGKRRPSSHASYQFAAYFTGNEQHRCRTRAVELETCESLIRSVELSPPPSILEYPTFGNEGTMGLGVRLALNGD